MTDTTFDRSSPPARERWREELEFRLIFAAVFAGTLIAELLHLLLPSHWRTGADYQQRMSIFAKAKQASDAAVGMAFMG